MTREQALVSFSSDDLIALGAEADATRNKMHPEGVVTYVIDSARPMAVAQSPNSYANKEDLVTFEIAATHSKVGNTGIRVPGTDTDRRIEWFETLLNDIRRQLPQIQLHGFSAPELLALASRSDLSLSETILRLHNAGLDSISGDSIRFSDSNGHASHALEESLTVHRTAHQVGMRTSVSVVFGMGESIDQRMDVLDRIRQLQEETGGFTAFTPLSHAPDTSKGERELDAPTGVEYLKMLAISRLYLLNIENIQASSVSQGLKVLQMGLRFGANDAGSVTTGKATAEEDLRHIIRDAGFRPVQRDTLYRTMFLN